MNSHTFFRSSTEIKEEKLMVESFRGKRASLDKLFDSKNNSLSFLRFFLAILVIVSHSYLLGNFGHEPLHDWSYEKKILGNIAVDSFFALSGFLITSSYLRSSSIWRYLWHRILRIFPGYWVCLFVTALVIGSIVYLFKYNLYDYFQESNTPLDYIKSNLWLQQKQIGISNLFNDTPYKTEVNGSLWTLRYEFYSYLFVVILGVLGLLRIRRAVLVLLCFLLGVYFFQKIIPGLPLASLPFLSLYTAKGIYTWEGKRLFLSFLGGAIFFLYREKIIIDLKIFIILGSITVLGLRFGFYDFISPFTIPYVLLWLAINLPLKNFENYVRGDYSYGLYIYSFPVQQTLSCFGFNQYGFEIYLLLSIGLTLPLAILSWQLIEKPCLRLKGVSLRSLIVAGRNTGEH